MKQTKKPMLAALILLVLSVAIIVPSVVSAASGGTKADSLEVMVGYFGGPYYLKHEFTDSEMNSLADTKQAYSFIDSMPAVCVDFARGVTLETLFGKAKIDLNSVKTFGFYSKGNLFVELKRDELLANRFYYPQLAYHYTADKGVSAGADKGKRQVKPMMAVSDNWQRYIPGDPELVEDYTTQNSDTRYRLLFGQTNVSEKLSSKSAECVYRIKVTLGGAPTLKVKDTDLDLKVGSKYRAEVTVSADSAIKEFVEKDIKWSSSDESIATVDKNGNVTVKKEGKVKIAATYTMGNGQTVTKSTTISGLKGTAGKKKENEKKEKDDEEGAAAGIGAGGNSGSDDSDSKGSGQKTIAIGKGKLTADAKALESKLEKKSKDKCEKTSQQNWRVYEMSETAVELPEIENNNDYEGALAGMMAGTIFLLGIAGRALIFYKHL